MEHIKSTIIAAGFVFLIVMALSLLYYLNSELFGPGIMGDVLALISVPFLVLYGLLSLGAAILVCMDVLRSKRGWVGRIMWILFVWFFGLFGAIVYYITVKGLGIPDGTVSALERMRPEVSAPFVALLFVAGVALLLGGVFMVDFGLVLLVAGTLTILGALYLSKNMGRKTA